MFCLQFDSNEAVRIIHALKNGVIPDAGFELLCVGRDRETKELGRCLDFTGEGNACVKFIAGEYGSGKSFLLHAARQLAIRRNFVVSRLQINKSFHLNSPEVLYYSIMHNLTMKDTGSTGTDFEGLFDVWISKLKSETSRERASNEIKEVIHTLNSYNSSFARAFLTYIKARIAQDSELAHASASWIKGEKNIPASVKARFDVKGDVDKHNSIDFLKAFIRLLSLIGYKGLLIEVDEVELVMGLRSDLRRSSYETLRFLVDTCFGGDFKSCMFLFAGTREVFDDEERGMKTYQALYQRLGDPLTKNSPSMTDMRQPVLRLNPFTLEDLQILTQRIVGLHKLSFDWEPEISVEAIRNWTLMTLSKDRGGRILPVNTREFTVKLIEILDIMEQNPGSHLFTSELRMVNKNGVDVFINTFSTKKPNSY